jgi:hypothetical protein
MNSSLTLNGAGAADSLFFGITVGDRGVETGVGVGGWLGSTGVPITFKTGSGSPTCSLKLAGDDGGWDVRPMRAESGPKPDFASESLESREPEFTPVNGPGVPGFEPDVTGCNLVFLRFEFLAGGLVVVEDIVDVPTWGRRSGEGLAGRRDRESWKLVQAPKGFFFFFLNQHLYPATAT